MPAARHGGRAGMLLEPQSLAPQDPVMSLLCNHMPKQYQSDCARQYQLSMTIFFSRYTAAAVLYA